jgi:hypothetical protein
LGIASTKLVELDAYPSDGSAAFAPTIDSAL